MLKRAEDSQKCLNNAFDKNEHSGRSPDDPIRDEKNGVIQDVSNCSKRYGEEGHNNEAPYDVTPILEGDHHPLPRVPDPSMEIGQGLNLVDSIAKSRDSVYPRAASHQPLLHTQESTNEELPSYPAGSPIAVSRMKFLEIKKDMQLHNQLRGFAHQNIGDLLIPTIIVKNPHLSTSFYEGSHTFQPSMASSRDILSNTSSAIDPLSLSATVPLDNAFKNSRFDPDNPKEESSFDCITDLTKKAEKSESLSLVTKVVSHKGTAYKKSSFFEHQEISRLSSKGVTDVHVSNPLSHSRRESLPLVVESFPIVYANQAVLQLLGHVKHQNLVSSDIKAHFCCYLPILIDQSDSKTEDGPLGRYDTKNGVVGSLVSCGSTTTIKPSNSDKHMTPVSNLVNIFPLHDDLKNQDCSKYEVKELSELSELFKTGVECYLGLHSIQDSSIYTCFAMSLDYVNLCNTGNVMTPLVRNTSGRNEAATGDFLFEAGTNMDAVDIMDTNAPFSGAKYMNSHKNAFKSFGGCGVDDNAEEPYLIIFFLRKTLPTGTIGIDAGKSDEVPDKDSSLPTSLRSSDIGMKRQSRTEPFLFGGKTSPTFPVVATNRPSVDGVLGSLSTSLSAHRAPLATTVPSSSPFPIIYNAKPESDPYTCSSLSPFPHHDSEHTGNRNDVDTDLELNKREVTKKSQNKDHHEESPRGSQTKFHTTRNSEAHETNFYKPLSSFCTLPSGALQGIASASRRKSSFSSILSKEIHTVSSQRQKRHSQERSSQDKTSHKELHEHRRSEKQEPHWHVPDPFLSKRMFSDAESRNLSIFSHSEGSSGTSRTTTVITRDSSSSHAASETRAKRGQNDNPEMPVGATSTPCTSLLLPTQKGRRISMWASRLSREDKSKTTKYVSYNVNPGSDFSNVVERVEDQIQPTESLSQNGNIHWSDPGRSHRSRKDFLKTWETFGTVGNTTKNTPEVHMAERASKPTSPATKFSALSLSGKREDTFNRITSGPQTSSLTPTSWLNDTGYHYLTSDIGGNEWAKFRLNSESFQGSSQRYSTDNRDVATRTSSSAFSPDSSNPRFVSFSAFQEDQTGDSYRQQPDTLGRVSNMSLSSRPAMTQRARSTDTVQVKNLRLRLQSLKGIATVQISKRVPKTFIMNIVSLFILLQYVQRYQRQCGAETPVHCFVNIRNTFIVVDLLSDIIFQGMTLEEMMSQLEAKYIQTDKKILREERSFAVSEAERVSQISFDITNGGTSGVKKSSPPVDNLKMASEHQFRLINHAFHTTHLPPPVTAGSTRRIDNKRASLSNASMVMGTGLISVALPDTSLVAGADGVEQGQTGFDHSRGVSPILSAPQSGTPEVSSPKESAYVPLEYVLPQELIDLLIHCNGSLNIRRDSTAVTLSLPYITKERLALLDNVETVQLSSQKGLFTFGVSLTNLLTEEAATKTNLESASLFHEQDEKNRSAQTGTPNRVLKISPRGFSKSEIGKDERVIEGRQRSKSSNMDMVSHPFVTLIEPLTTNDGQEKRLSEGDSRRGVRGLHSDRPDQSTQELSWRKSSAVKFVEVDSTNGSDDKAPETLDDIKNADIIPNFCGVEQPETNFSTAGLATAAAGASLPSVLKNEDNVSTEFFPCEEKLQAECLFALERDDLKENIETQATSLSHPMLLTTEDPKWKWEQKTNDVCDRETTPSSKDKPHVKPECRNFSSEAQRQEELKSKGYEFLGGPKLPTSVVGGLISTRLGLECSNDDVISSSQKNDVEVTASAEDQQESVLQKPSRSSSILRKNTGSTQTTSQSSSGSRKATKSVSFENSDVGVEELPPCVPSLSFASVPNDSLVESFPNMFRILGTRPSIEGGKDSKKHETKWNEDVNGNNTYGARLSSGDSQEGIVYHNQTSFESNSSPLPKNREESGWSRREVTSPLEVRRLFYVVIYTTKERPDIEEELGRCGHCCLFITSPEKMLRYMRARMDRFDLLLVEWNDKLVTPEVENFLLGCTSEQTVVMYHVTITEDNARNHNPHSKSGEHKRSGGVHRVLPEAIPESAILRSPDIASVFLNIRMQRQTLDYFFRKRLLREMLELRVIQSYQIVRQIGSGAGGDVFEVVLYASKGHLAMKRIFLKNMSLRGIERLSREVHILSSLDHPNVIIFSHTCSAGNDFCIFMELCDGNLSQRIRTPASLSHRAPSDSSSVQSHIRLRARKSSIAISSKNSAAPTSSIAGLTPISPEEAVLIIHDIASGIAYLHNQGIIHRDIKPANILFANNVAKLGDFGSAVRVHERHPLTNMKGTLSYMAPEVILGEPYGKPCDMWSFGCVLTDIMGFNLAHLIGLHIPALVELYDSLSMAESLPVTIANLTVSRPENLVSSTTSRGVLEAVRTASIQAAKERDELGTLYTSQHTPESTPSKSPFARARGSRTECQAPDINVITPRTDNARSQRQKSSMYLDMSNEGRVDYMARSSSMPPRLPATLPVEDPIGVPLTIRYTKSPGEFSSSMDKRQQHQPNKSRYDAGAESSGLTIARTVTCISISKNSVVGTRMVSLPRSLVELLESLFHRDPAKRMTIEEVLEHPVTWNVEWMTSIMAALHQVNESITSANIPGSNLCDVSSHSSKTARFSRGMGYEAVPGIGLRGTAFEEKLSLSLNSSPLFVADDRGTQKQVMPTLEEPTNPH
ncbi:unnamed protein product [Phytomonas sp. EM1]|nr:unnamed protein product [Phytomonas sp. EM1]|eukprot:CCW64450.1 unnamed protein product [Phytomonas sp. isolate EM1]